MKKTIGKIYQSKIQHVGDGHYRFTLIGIISPKKASVIKYDIKLDKEEGKSKNEPPKIKLNLSKEFYKDCRLTISKTGLGDAYEITTPGEYPVIFDYHTSSLNFLASPDAIYIDSTLETIGEKVIEPYYGNEFLALGSAIMDSLTGKLMTKNQLSSALKLPKQQKGPKNIDLARLISKVTSTLMKEHNYLLAHESGKFGTRYIDILTEMFEQMGATKKYLETPSAYAKKLSENPTLVYEYLLMLSPQEIDELTRKIATLYDELRAFYKLNNIGDTPMLQVLNSKSESLLAALSNYNQNYICFNINNDTIVVTRRDPKGEEQSSPRQLTPTISESRILRALKHITKKIPPRIPTSLKKASASLKRRKND